MVRLLPVAALLLLAACAPDPAPPVKVRALVLSPGGTYVPEEVELTQIEDVVALRGQVTYLLGGARIRMDPNDPDVRGAPTEAGLAAAITKEPGRPVSASYISEQGVLWPADFHTWNMVSAYYALEQASRYFRAVGGPATTEPEPIPTYYFPEFSLPPSLEPMRDNAIYFPLVHGMMLMPFDQLQRAPLAINAGVLAHEYSHRLFNRFVYGGRRLPEPLVRWASDSPSPGLNLLKSVDEGLADYHAFGVTCQSRFGCNSTFLSTSFNEELTQSRDLARKDLCMDASLRDQLLRTGFDQFSGLEYRVGTLLAAALYQAGEQTNQREVLQQAVLAAYSDPSTATPGLAQLVESALADQNRFTLAAVAGALIQHVDSRNVDLRRALCNELMDRLAIARTELIRDDLCPASASGGTNCPDLAP